MLLSCRRLLFVGLAFCLQSEAQEGVKSCHDCVRLGHAWYNSTRSRECVSSPTEAESKSFLLTLTTDAPGCEKLGDEDSKASDTFDPFLRRNCSDCVKKRVGSDTIEILWVVGVLVEKVSFCLKKANGGTWLEEAQQRKIEKAEVYSECDKVPPEYVKQVLPGLPVEKTSCEACISSKAYIWCNHEEAIFCMYDYHRIFNRQEFLDRYQQSPFILCPGEAVTQCNMLGPANRKRQLGRYPNDCDGCVKAGGGWCMSTFLVGTVRHCAPIKFGPYMCLGKPLTDCSGLTAADKKGTESFGSHTNSSGDTGPNTKDKNNSHTSSSGLSIFLILALVLTV